MTFKSFFQNNTVKFFIIVFVFVLFVINFAFYLFSYRSFEEEQKRQQEGFLEMMEHLITMEGEETAIVYLEHYYHTQGVDIVFLDIEGDILYQSNQGLTLENKIALYDTNQELLGSVIYNDTTSFVALDLRDKLLFLNFMSFLLFLVVVFLLKYYVNSWYTLLAKDLEKIGKTDHHFQFHDLEQVHDKMKELLQKEKNMREFQMKSTKALAHDLRTPLTVIKAYIEGVQLEKIAFTKEVVDQINQEIDEIEGLIPQLMEESRQMAYQEVDIKECIEEVSNRLIQAFSMKEIQLEMHLDPLYVRVPKEDILRILENVLLNAYLYTPKHGSITILLQKKLAQISIEDSGIGMSKSELDMVLLGHYRTKDAQRLNPEGTGSGLQIVREICFEHGFGFALESKQTKGSKVTIRFGAL